jgi:hypothetical protein
MAGKSNNCGFGGTLRINHHKAGNAVNPARTHGAEKLRAPTLSAAEPVAAKATAGVNVPAPAARRNMFFNG